MSGGVGGKHQAINPKTSSYQGSKDYTVRPLSKVKIHNYQDNQYDHDNYD